MKELLIPQYWQIKKIGELCTLMTGGTPSKANPSYFDGGEIKWLVSGDIHLKEIFDCPGRITQAGYDNSNAKFLPINSVIIALNGQGKTKGSVALLRTKATCNQSLVSIYPKNTNELLPEYLFHNLNGRYLEIRKLVGDDDKDRRGLNMPIIRGIQIPVPPIEEQKRIVEILDKAFEGIAQAEANTRRNLINARELFDSYLNNIFRERGDEWIDEKLGDISENLDSERIPVTKSKRTSGKVPYYGASGVVDYVDDFIFDEELLLVSEDGANLLARTYPIAFSISGKAWVNNHAHVLKFNDISLQRFIEYFLNSISLERYVSGMAQPKLNQKALNSILIPIAPKEIREKVVNNLDSLKGNVNSLETIYQRKLEAIAELKQSILEKAFTGQLSQ